MVKLFIGNLADGIDSSRLRNLFGKFVQVQECDVLKNFAFVHVSSEKDADIAIQKFDGYTLDGKEIHVERSTSHLRKQPGMGDKCFTCGAEEHKTSQCPRNPNRRKREMHDPSYEESVPKRPKPLILDDNSSKMVQQPQTQCWGYKVGGGSDADPELPRPQNPELLTLYEQYLDSRTRYFFYREQLNKELRVNNGAIVPQPNNLQQPSHIAPPVLQQPSYTSTLTSHPPPSQDPNPPPQIIRVDLTQHIRNQGQAAPIITTRTPTNIPPLPENTGYFGTPTNINKTTVQQANYNYSSPYPSESPLPIAYSSSSSSSAFNSTPIFSANGSSRQSMRYNTAPPARPPVPTGQPLPLSSIHTTIPPEYKARR